MARVCSQRSTQRSADAQAAPRQVTTLGATALVVANMIGTGIFVTSGFMARDLGNPWAVLAAWLLGGALALSGASVYAELGAMMPRAGGEYVYLSRAFHPAVGFVAGWVSLWVGFSAPVAASSVAFAHYLQAVWPQLHVPLTAALLIAAISLLHMADVKWGARVQIALTMLKVLLLAGFSALALAVGRGSWSHFELPARAPSGSAMAVALVLVAFSYSGWNAAAYVAGELRTPSRTLPRALGLGTTLVVSLYLLLNVVLFYAAPAAMLGRQPEVVADIAARRLFGAHVGDAVSVAIALALVSSISAMTMTGPRVILAMAEDGLFFRAFARRGARGAPWLSVATQGAVAIVLVLTAAFEALLTYIGFTLTAFSALVVVGAFVLRAREPDAVRPYRAWGWPIAPALFVVLSLWMVVFSLRARPLAGLLGLLTLASGWGLYWLRLRFRA